MIKIQVLGRGLIPRLNVIAPKKEPFPADKTLIATIISTPGLTVNFINPETGAPTQITKSNLQRIWDKWSNWTPKEKVTHTAPHVPEKPPINNGEQNLANMTGGMVGNNTFSSHEKETPKPPVRDVVRSEEPKTPENKDAVKEDAPKAEEKTEAKDTAEKTSDGPDKKDDKKDEKPAASQQGSQKNNNNFKPIVKDKDKK